MTKPRTLAISAFAFLALLLGLAGTALAYPALGTIACPQCYGFRPVSVNLWAERLNAIDEARLTTIVEDARQDLSSFFGGLVGSPRVLVCTDDACFRRLGGGGARAITILDVGLIVSPRGVDPVIVRHELSHAELHAELGFLKTIDGAVPQWFDEGLAVNVSDDPRYLAPVGSDRCLVEPTGELPADRHAWIQGAQNDLLYAKAACIVSRWLGDAKGPERVRSLVRALNAGQPFETSYRSAGG
jgi:hypothetical protein